MAELFVFGMATVHLMAAAFMSFKIKHLKAVESTTRYKFLVIVWLIPLVGSAFVSDLTKNVKTRKNNGGVATNDGGNSSIDCGSDGSCD